MTRAAERQLKLVEAVVRLINHKLRTPLSVIANELFCLQTEEEREEISRAASRVKEISRVLSEAAALPLEVVEPKGAVLGNCVPRLREGKEIALQGEPTILARGFSRLDELLKSYGNDTLAWEASLSGGMVLVRTTGLSGLSIEGDWDLAIDFSAAQGAADSFLPLEIDCAITAHGGALQISISGGTLSCEVRLPVNGSV